MACCSQRSPAWLQGRALDVGCGSGADAIWLARQGWQVTAVDVSQAALDRAAIAAHDAEVAVNWVCTDISTIPPAVGDYDLVSVQYPALRHSPDESGDPFAPGRSRTRWHDPGRRPWPRKPRIRTDPGPRPHRVRRARGRGRAARRPLEHRGQRNSSPRNSSSPRLALQSRRRATSPPTSLTLNDAREPRPRAKHRARQELRGRMPNRYRW